MAEVTDNNQAKLKLLKGIAWCFFIIVTLVICCWLYQMVKAFYAFYVFRTSDMVKNEPRLANAYSGSTIGFCFLILFYLLGLLRLNIQILFKPTTVKTAITKLIVIFLVLIVPLTAMLYIVFFN